MRRKICWLYITNVLCLLLIYLGFISLHWLPLSISIVIMVTFTVLGIENTLYLIKFSYRNNLHNVRQILNYLNGKHAQQTKLSKQKLWIQYIFWGLLGVISYRLMRKATFPIILKI